ncbi:MAG TPA: hypothetical protein VGL11_08915 [Candidatus Binatia bacterium]
MEQFSYRSHSILAAARRTACVDYWVPVARVSWDDPEGIRDSVLTGGAAWFKSEEEATLHAVAMARSWIENRGQGFRAVLESSSSPSYEPASVHGVARERSSTINHPRS